MIDSLMVTILGLGLLYVAFSTLPYLSLVAFLRLLSCALFYVLVRCAARTEGSLRFFLWVTLISGVFYSIYGLVQYYGFLPHSYWYQPWSLASRYVNGGHFGAFLFFPLFTGIALLVSSRKVVSQLVHISFLLIMGWALLLSRSRMVWIAFFIGLVIFIWLVQRGGLLKGKTVFGLGLFVLLALGLLVAHGGAGEIAKRFQELSNAIYTPLDAKATKFYSLVYRLNLWKAASRAIADNPLGWGLGTFSTVFPQYRLHSDRFFVDYAHNEFLQVGVDLGIPGILLLAAFLFLCLRRTFSFLSKDGISASARAIAAGFFALWIGLVLVSQFDFPVRIYANGLFLASTLALSAYLFDSVRTRSVAQFTNQVLIRRSELRFFRSVSFVVVFAAAFLATQQLFAQIHFETGQILEKDFAWQKAQEEYERAVKASPHYAAYQEALATLCQKRASISLNQKQKKLFAGKAIEAYKKSIRANPYKSDSHYYLAFVYESERDLERAEAEFRKAIELEPTNALLVADYGYFALRNSMTKEAISAFEKLKGIPFQEGVKTNFCLIARECYRLTQDYKDLKRIIPDDSWGHNCLGTLLAENGRWDLAKLEFDLALRRATLENHQEDMQKRISDFYLEHNHPYEVGEIQGGLVPS